jgi:hypothetical protein
MVETHSDRLTLGSKPFALEGQVSFVALWVSEFLFEQGFNLGPI